MDISEIKVGMVVFFGLGRGEQTKGEVIKVNRKSVGVRTLENRGSKSEAGAKWKVHPSLVTLAEEGTNAVDAAISVQNDKAQRRQQRSQEGEDRMGHGFRQEEELALLRREVAILQGKLAEANAIARDHLSFLSEDCHPLFRGVDIKSDSPEAHAKSAFGAFDMGMRDLDKLTR